MDTNEVVEGLHEIELTNITKDGYPKGAPDQFKLLQVLGQGSFGKVFYYYVLFCMQINVSN